MPSTTLGRGLPFVGLLLTIAVAPLAVGMVGSLPAAAALRGDGSVLPRALAHQSAMHETETR
jgi:hypothetical protein